MWRRGSGHPVRHGLVPRGSISDQGTALTVERYKGAVTRPLAAVGWVAAVPCLLMEDLLRSARALAYLSVLATDAPLPLAVTRLRDEMAKSGVRDRTLLTDELRLLQVFFAAVSDWNWSPEIQAL